MKQGKYDKARLLFRRQFVLGPEFPDGFPDWGRIEMMPSIRLTVHPDLPVHLRRTKTASIVLLGYLLDPHRPGDGDEEIVRRLIAHIEAGGTRESLIRLTYPLGGRWILIVDAGHYRLMFNDPCGYRQLFFAQTSFRGLWCASQPGILANLLNLAMDEDALAFIQAYRKREPYYWWPGDSTPYKEIRHLQPNRYLDLESGRCHRYWPNHDLTRRPLDEVVSENAQLLQGLIESASRRFGLALSVTAGRDTRLLLAASKSIRHQLYFFTLMYLNMNSNSPDIRVPSTLLTRLRLPHHVIRCPPRMERKFRELYQRNVTTAREAYGAIAQGLYDHYPSDKVCMKGNAITIATHYSLKSRLRSRWPDFAGERIDAPTLAWLTNRESPFAVAALDRWLSEMGETNIDMLDLFFWEEREGNWQAMSQSEWDIVHDVLVPYNCRLFLANALSVDEKYRSPPAYAFHEKLIRRLWPEVLTEPINPPARPTMVSSVALLLEAIRHKVVEPDASAAHAEVQRAFHRFPWLTQINRILIRCLTVLSLIGSYWATIGDLDSLIA